MMMKKITTSGKGIPCDSVGVEVVSVGDGGRPSSKGHRVPATKLVSKPGVKAGTETQGPLRRLSKRGIHTILRGQPSLEYRDLAVNHRAGVL